MKNNGSLNRSFRHVWSQATRSWHVAPETARRAGKGGGGLRRAVAVLNAAGVSFALTAVASLTHAQQAPPAATQLPTGGAVARGVASIGQSTSANTAVMTINQSTPSAVLNWNTFNVGSNAQVNFNQPSSSAVTLNRVNDVNASQIYGRISAPGQVFLTNPNGVYFSSTAQVDVGALTATTHSVSDNDFMAGNYRFERQGATGKVVNEGKLNAALGGYIALLAPEVQNAGVIVAQAGTVAMAAGEVINLNFAGNHTLAGISTTPSTIASLVENKLAVRAPDGQIILSAVALNKLQAGVVKNSGSLQANSLVNQGGKITLEGDGITLAAGSKIEATGPTGGGTVLVGGDWQGSGEMRQATQVTMEAGATIDASATDKGDGGKVVLWSDVHNVNSQTQAHGNIKAEAGPLGGDGGKVETSGHWLNVDGIQVSTQSPQAHAGTWLLDPYDVTISTSATATDTLTSGVYTPSANTSNILNTDLQTALANGNVEVTTTGAGTQTGNITLSSALTWATGNVLTLTAAGGVSGSGNIAMTGGGGLIFKQAGNTTYAGIISGNGSVTKQDIGTLSLSGANTYTGATTINAGTVALTGTGSIAASSGLTVNAAGTFDIAGSPVGTGASITSLSGSGAVSLGTTSMPLNITNASGNFSGVISGASTAGIVTIAGGTETFSGSNTFVGNTVVNAGATLIAANANALGAANTSQIRIYGTLDVSVASLNASRSLRFLGTTGTITNSGTTVSIVTLSNPVNTSSQTLILDAGSGATLKLTSAIPSITTYGLTKGVGAGTVELTSVNTYTGSTTVNGGTLALTGTGSVATSSGVTVNAGTFDISGTTSGASIASLAGAGAVNLGAQPLTLTAATGAFSGAMSGTASAATTALTLSGGTQTLSGANTYSGQTLVSGGTLVVSNSAALGATSAGTTVNTGATLDVQGTTLNAEPITLSGGTLTNSAANTSTVNSNIALTAASSVNAGTSATLNLGGVISGGFGLTKASGAGTVVLSGNNTYTGSTALNGGYISLGSSGALGSTSAISFSGGGLQLTATNANDYSALFSNAANQAYKLDTNGQTGTLASALTSTGGSLTKIGSGTLILSGNNSYTGTTTVSAGTLKLNNVNALGTVAAGTTIASGAALDLNGQTVSNAEALSLAGTGVSGSGALFNSSASPASYAGLLTLTAASTLVGSNGGISLTNTGTITGSGLGLTLDGTATGNSLASIIGTAAGTVTKAGTGTWMLSGANTYTGTTTVSGGALVVSNAAALGATSAGTTVNTGATLDVQGTTLNAEPITLSGGTLTNSAANTSAISSNIALTAASSVDAGTGATLNLGGVISGGFGLTKASGTGTVVLSGNNTYTGSTTISGGTLQVGAAGTSGTLGAGLVVDNATLFINRSGNYALSAVASNAGAITGTGNIKVQSTTGTLNIDRAITLSGVNSQISLLANSTALGNASLNSDLTLTNTITTSDTGTIVIFAGSPTATLANGATSALMVKMAGATGSLKYKTYNADGTALTGAVAGTRNFYYRQPETVSLTGTVTASKTYDGLLTANATISNVGTSGAIDGDSFTGSLTSATFNTATAGTNKAMTVSASLSSAASTSWRVSGNTTNTAGLTYAGTILQAPLTITAIDDARFITQSDAAVFAGVRYSGFVNSETSAVLGGALTVTRTNAGTNGIGTYNAVLQPGGLTSTNYSITFNKGSYTIVPAGQLLIRVADATSVYGSAANYSISSAEYLSASNNTITSFNLGTQLSLLNGVYTLLDGVSGTATFRLGASNATLSASHNASVGTWGVGATGAVTTSANFSNVLTVVGQQTITAKPLTLTATGIDKVYDAGNTATVALGSTDAIAGDALTFNYASASFSDKNVGTNKAVSTSGLTVTGNDSANYSLQNQTANAQASIAAAPLTVSGLTAANKPYDAASNATITGTASVTPLGLDVVTVNASGVTASFANSNVGTGKAVTLSGVTLAGSDAGNYYPVPATNLTADITAKSVSITGLLASSKTYDGTNSVTPTNWGAVSTGVGNETLVLNPGTASFADANVGTGKTVTAFGYTLANGSNGGLAANYVLSSTTATTTADITAAALSVNATSSNKTFGQTFIPSTTAFTSSGLVHGETIASVSQTLSGGGAATDNVGTYTMTSSAAVAGVGTQGTTFSANNYNITYNAGNLVVDPLAVSLIGAKNFDNTTTLNTTATGSTLSVSNGVAGATVHASGSAVLGGSAAGSQSIVGFGGLSLDNANYTLTGAVGTVNVVATAQINVQPLTQVETAALVGAQLASLTNSQIAAFSTTQLQVFTPSVLSALSASQLSSLSANQLNSLSPTQMQSLAPAQVALFSDTQLSGLVGEQLSNLTPTQLQVLSPAQVAVLSNTQISALTPTQLSALGLNQVASLSPNQVGALVNQQVVGLTVAQLQAMSAVQVNAFSNSQLSVMTAAQISALSIAGGLSFAQVDGLSPVQIAALSTQQLLGLTAAQLGALSDVQFQSLTVDQLAALLPSQLGALSGPQIVTMSSQQISGLTPAQLQQFSKGQIQALSDVQLAAMTPMQLAAIGLNGQNTTSSVVLAAKPPLEPTSVPATTPQPIVVTQAEPVRGMSGSQIRAFTPSQLTALSADQIAAFSAAQLQALTTLQIASLQPSQLSGLSAAQLAALSPGQLQAMNKQQMTTVLLSQTTALDASQKLAISDVLTAQVNTSDTLLAGGNQGVLPIVVLGPQVGRTGIAFEQANASIKLKLTDMPLGGAVASATNLEGNYITFMVTSAKNELVEFKGAMIGKRIVIIAPTAAAKQMAASEVPLVLASAITALSMEQRIVMASLEGVLFDLR